MKIGSLLFILFTPQVILADVDFSTLPAPPKSYLTADAEVVRRYEVGLLELEGQYAGDDLDTIKLILYSHYLARADAGVPAVLTDAHLAINEVRGWQSVVANLFRAIYDGKNNDYAHQLISSLGAYEQFGLIDDAFRSNNKNLIYLLNRDSITVDDLKKAIAMQVIRSRLLLNDVAGAEAFASGIQDELTKKRALVEISSFRTIYTIRAESAKSSLPASSRLPSSSSGIDDKEFAAKDGALYDAEKESGDNAFSGFLLSVIAGVVILIFFFWYLYFRS